MMNSIKEGVSVVIPAYNEQDTISGVVRAALGHHDVKEVLVVSDGSRDDTAKEVRQFGGPVKLLNYKRNRGKGFALSKGIGKTKFPLVVLLDADLIGVRPDHIDRMIVPLKEGSTDHVLASINLLRAERKWYLKAIENSYNNLIRDRYLIAITGQRAGRREDLTSIKGLRNTRYGVDILITDYYLSKGKKIEKFAFDDIKHRRKSEKWGEEKGSKELRMATQDVLSTFIRLKARKALLKTI